MSTFDDLRDHFIFNAINFRDEEVSREEAGVEFDAIVAEHDRQVAEKAWDEGMVASVNADLGDWENPPDLPTNPYRASSNTRPEGETQ